MATEFSLEQARERLAELLERVEGGEDIVISRLGAGAARLRPVRASRPDTGPCAEFVPAADRFAAEASTGAFDIGTDYWSD